MMEEKRILKMTLRNMNKRWKTLFLEALIALAVAFVAFAIGRVSHIYGGHLYAPHHWIYGALSIIAGVVIFVFYKKRYAIYVIAFGVGMLVSDAKDMCDLKLIGVDLPGVKVFWGID